MKNEVSYLYIGQYYYDGDTELNVTDKKIGHTTNPDIREKQLSRTKGPIKVMYLKLWKFDGKNTAREVEHGMIHHMFSDIRIDGCEWFSDEDETLEERLTLFLNNLNKFNSSIDEISIENQYTSKEKQIRKKQTKLSVFINDNKIDGENGNEIFVNSLKSIGLDNVWDILPNVVTKDEFIGKSFNNSELVNGYWININSGNKRKSKYLKKLFDNLEMNGRVNLD